jgi:hypothetical protein
MLPPTVSYEVWRFDASSALVAASARPVQVAAWLGEVRDSRFTFAMLSNAGHDFAVLDARLFQALVSALQGPNATLAEQELLLMARRACTLGAGRQLWRLIDGEYGRDQHGRHQRALKLLMTFRPCTSSDQLEPSLLQLETLLAELRGTSQEPTVEFLNMVVKTTFEKVPSLAALFAAVDLQGLLSPGLGQPLKVLSAIRKSILDERDQTMMSREFVPPKGGNKKKKDESEVDGHAAPAAKAQAKADPKGKGKGKGKGKDKGKDAGKSKGKRDEYDPAGGSEMSSQIKVNVSCSWCSRPGHEKERCWYNPKSSTYKGPKGSGAVAPEAEGSQCESLGPSASQLFQQNGQAGREFAGSATAQNRSSTGSTAHTPLPSSAALDAMSFHLEALRRGHGLLGSAAALKEIILDTGASYHLAPSMAISPGTQQKREDGGIILCTAAGLQFYDEVGTICLEGMKPLIALQVADESPCALSLGQLVKDGFSFSWLADDPINPKLYDQDGEVIPLRVSQDVPMLQSGLSEEGADERPFKRSSPQYALPFQGDGEDLRDHDESAVVAPLASPREKPGQEEVDPSQNVAESLDDMEAAVPIPAEQELAEKPGITRKAKPLHNALAHRPADPHGCSVCRDAKLAQAPARRIAEPYRAKALGEVSADTIGPLIASHDGARFILTAKDDWSGFCSAVPLARKEARGVANAFDATIGFEFTKKLRVDPGTEFMG